MDKIGIVGLGLIGGSFAKALSARKEFEVYGYDVDSLTVKLAVLTESIDGELTAKHLAECDYIFLALYPQAIKDYLNENAQYIKRNAVVIDCCGVKRAVCDSCFRLAAEAGFDYIGGHPMAGTQFSGFKYAKEEMFHDACMILVPKPDEDICLLERVKGLLTKIGFAHVTISTAERHDTIIAYTSQLAHVVSNAYVKSPNAQVHKGFSAGSYKDLTRVARLNEAMWTELFLDNADNLSGEIDYLIASLKQYSKAIKEKDASALMSLLREGRECKERVDDRGEV